MVASQASPRRSRTRKTFARHAPAPATETLRYVYIFNYQMMYFIDESQDLIEMLTLRSAS